MAIRKFSLDDLDALIEIEDMTFARTAFSRRTFLRFHADSRSAFVVWVDDGEVCGYVIASLCSSASFLYIASLAVKEDSRRKGIGSALVREILRAGGEAGVSGVWLHVRVSNGAAREFYKKLGFEVLRKAPDYYREEDAYVMGRRLRGNPSDRQDATAQKSEHR